MNQLAAQLRTLFGDGKDSGNGRGLPRWFTDAETPVPLLQAVLNSGDEINGVHDLRHELAEKLRSVDSVAFWIQAVGDGTPLDHGHNDIIERSAPFSPVYLTGYADDLTHPDIVDISPHLFSHHLGMQTDPSLGDPNKSASQLIGEEVRSLSGIAEQQYAGDPFSVDALQLPKTGSYEDNLDRAITLLKEDDLTMFWAQILCDEEPVMMSISSGPGETEVNFLPRPIEWGRGAAQKMDEQASSQVALHMLIQHLFVGARTAGQDLDTFRQQVLKMEPEQHHAENEFPG